jgi:arabinofuranosyltransferase
MAPADSFVPTDPVLEQRRFRTTFRSLVQWSLFLAPIVLLGLLGWSHRWIADDGYIYLRIVRQLEAGNGPVFNAGQRVEAFTGPLWVGMLTIADVGTPFRLEWIAVGLGILLSLAGVAFAMAGAARLARGADGRAFLAPVGVLVFGALLATWYFESSGLETALVFAWLGAG